MYCSVKNFLQLILRISLDFSSVATHQNLRISKTFAEKHLKLVSYNQNRAVCILFSLILLLAEVNSVSKKKPSKKNSISALSSNSDKIILILLTKIVTFYVKSSTIHVQKTGF